MVEFVDGESLCEKQVNTIKEVYPKAHIYYITGFYADKIDNTLKKMGCKVVHNANFAETSTSYTIGLALKHIKNDALVIYGDLLFNTETLVYLPTKPQNSYLLKDVGGYFNKGEVGLGENGVLNYCYKEKWSQIFYLNDADVNKFCAESLNPKNTKRFGFETINSLADKGSKFDVYGASGYIFEVDRLKDLSLINEKLFIKGI